MATITSKRIRLYIEWTKDDPDNFTYWVDTAAVLPDDTKLGGEEEIGIRSPDATITRTAFRALTGTQIENNVKSLSAASLDELGSGAGTHTLVDDIGN